MNDFIFNNTIPKKSRYRAEAERLWRDIETKKKDGTVSVAYIVAKVLGNRSTEETFINSLRTRHQIVVE